MMTVREVSRITGVSIRTLHHYDRIGLLKPAGVTDAGYRMYDSSSLERLQQILLFRELEFPLAEIREILNRPDFDREKVLEQQIRLLEMRRDRLTDLIRLARETKENGGRKMDFSAFGEEEIKRYTEEAKASWGKTEAWHEYENKSAGRTGAEQKALNREMMELFREFGTVRDQSPDSPEARSLVRRLQKHITEHYYTCTDEILLSLGRMYASGGDFTENIDRAGGIGTAAFVCLAIESALRG